MKHRKHTNIKKKGSGSGGFVNTTVTTRATCNRLRKPTTEKKGFCLLFVVLFFVSGLFAQSLDWTIEDMTFSEGDSVEARFVVTGFDEITAFQYALMADPAKLQYLGIIATGALSNYDAECCFSKPEWLPPGEIRSVWTDPFGVSVPDGSHVFSIYFKALQSGYLHESLTLWNTLEAAAWYLPIVRIPFTLGYISPVTSTENIAYGEYSTEIYNQSGQPMTGAPDTWPAGIYYRRIIAGNRLNTKIIFKQ